MLILSCLVGFNIHLLGVLCFWGKRDFSGNQYVLVVSVISIKFVVMPGNFICVRSGSVDVVGYLWFFMYLLTCGVY